MINPRNRVLAIGVAVLYLVFSFGIVAVECKDRREEYTDDDTSTFAEDSIQWLRGSAGYILGMDITTTVVSGGCQNVPWASRVMEEMEVFAVNYVTRPSASPRVYAKTELTLGPQNELYREMRWTGAGFTNARGEIWDKWSLRCPPHITGPCRLPTHSHVVVFIFTFKYRDMSEDSSEAFERIVVVVEGEAPEITHWQKSVPASAECHKELSRITRLAQSSRSKQLFHANNICGGRLDLIHSANWAPTHCPNQGIYMLGWTATNEFQIYSTKHSVTSVIDSKYPTVKSDVTRTLCIVDDTHQVGTPDAPKLCLAKMVEYYARTTVIQDNCDEWDELNVFVDSRERVICDGKGEEDPLTGELSRCYSVPESLQDILEEGSKLEAPYHPYYEKCVAPADASITRYMLKIGDICDNYHPVLVDFTVHYVGSLSACPTGSFLVDASTVHLKDDST